MKRVLVGTDGSDWATKAVAHAVALAEATGAELVVVYGYRGPTMPGGPEPASNEAIGRAILRDVVTQHGREARIRTVLRQGDPADAVVEVAAEEDVDLIVVGSRGMGRAGRFVLGPVPNRVAHHAPCNVLIVKTK